MNVQLFIPCFVDQLFPETGFNMVKVLEKLGCNVSQTWGLSETTGSAFALSTPATILTDPMSAGPVGAGR